MLTSELISDNWFYMYIPDTMLYSGCFGKAASWSVSCVGRVSGGPRTQYIFPFETGLSVD